MLHNVNYCYLYLFIFHLSFPKLREDWFGVTFRVIYSFTLLQAVNAISASILWWVCTVWFTLTILGWFFPSFYLVWVQHGVPCCWTTLFWSRNQLTYRACVCFRSGIICLCAAAARRNFWNIPSLLYTPTWSVRSHATRMFCNRSANL